MYNIIEDNILVVKFMGSVKSIVDYTTYNDDGSIKYTNNEDGSKWMVDEYSKPDGLPEDVYWCAWLHGTKLKYHKSWDWLMPVVEKIKDTPRNHKKGYWNYIDKIDESIINVDIKATHKAVVEFIKWYNLNKLT